MRSRKRYVLPKQYNTISLYFYFPKYTRNYILSLTLSAYRTGYSIFTPQYFKTGQISVFHAARLLAYSWEHSEREIIRPARVSRKNCRVWSRGTEILLHVNLYRISRGPDARLATSFSRGTTRIPYICIYACYMHKE